MLLNKTLRSSTLKLAAIYIAVVGAAIVGLFGYVYWASLSFVHAIAARGVAAEQALQHFDRALTFALGGAVGLLLLLATAAGVSTSRRSVSRIEAINAASREIMRTGLGQRIPLRGTGDEWDELADNLNSMLARIEELVERVTQETAAQARRVAADELIEILAHDLRTPLTRVRGRLEKAYQRPPAVGEYPALIGAAIAELDGILKTFSSLLRISRIEAQDRGHGFREVDLGALAREVVELFEPAAEDAGVMLRVFGDDGMHAIGDRDLLFDALSNLLDNAIHHGGRGGRVAIALAHDGTGLTVSVADGGPGIPAEERHNVLKRFYRLERSRNSPGNGLGLSLVAAVAGLHGARLEMSDNAPGLRVTLHFARLAAAPGRATHDAPAENLPLRSLS